jgi:hypothetical protein
MELVTKSANIGLFVKGLMKKIFETFNIGNLDKFPNNFVKFRNYIFSLLNNNANLKLIANNIVFIEYDKLINVIGDGIIYEMLTKDLIVLADKKKIMYNLKNIEIEKHRINN